MIMTSIASLHNPRKVPNHDEISMPQCFFSESLKDLKNLQSQLYSAAKYFELSYTNDDKKQTVVETLKNYTFKAFLNTVDHLDSVTYKLNDLMDEKVDEVSGTELRVSCVQQRLHTCQEFINHGGLSQQSLKMNEPKYHKRYILPVGVTAHSGGDCTKSIYEGCRLYKEDDWLLFKNSVEATAREIPPLSIRRGRSSSPSSRLFQRLSSFSVTGATPKGSGFANFCQSEKQTVSPYRLQASQSGSFPGRLIMPSLTRPPTPNLNSSRPATPKASAMRRCPSEPRRSFSMPFQGGKEQAKDGEQYPSKSKRLFRALLTRRSSSKDENLYRYLDEY